MVAKIPKFVLQNQPLFTIAAKLNSKAKRYAFYSAAPPIFWRACAAIAYNLKFHPLGCTHDELSLFKKYQNTLNSKLLFRNAPIEQVAKFFKSHTDLLEIIVQVGAHLE